MATPRFEYDDAGFGGEQAAGCQAAHRMEGIAEVRRAGETRIGGGGGEIGACNDCAPDTEHA
ncbi:hypothetical protein [Nocardia sp. NPDC058633]|uniref:hypothetical protein n=1 Tax=Nocardia sp. NPDC058633 TaxID=3346568 RepID=UPI003666E2FD